MASKGAGGGIVLVVLIAIFSVIGMTGTGRSGESTATSQTAPTVAATQSASAAKAVIKDQAPQNTKPDKLTARLAPPPAGTCVGGAYWCGKKLLRASQIVDVMAWECKLPRRAWVVGIATVMQESSLTVLASPVVPESKNYPHDTVDKTPDHDSVGLFQQRPSQGWGSVKDLMDPRMSTIKFCNALKDKTDNWKNWLTKRPLTEIAQAVQKSGYPNAYAKHESTAIKIVDYVTQFTK